MIYLFSNIITIPNLTGISSSVYHIELKNNVTNEIFTQDVSNHSCNELYYSFTLDPSCLSQNEYTLSLYDDTSTLLGTFLACNGNYTHEKEEFLNNIQYILFDPEKQIDEDL